MEKNLIFNRYIYKLYDLHLQAENYTEAGFTLKLYADMLSWSRETLTFAPNDTVGQQEWERKENLYKEVKNSKIRLCYLKLLIYLFLCTDFEEFRQRKMLGERNSVMQGIGRIL